MIFLETFGCQMNTLDSELIKNLLEKHGYKFISNINKANIVIYNTCSVRKLSEQKILSRLGILKKRKDIGEKIIVGILGCMSERINLKTLTRDNPIDFILGPSKLFQIPKILKTISLQKNKKIIIKSSKFINRKNIKIKKESIELNILDNERTEENFNFNTKAFVRITRGCDKFCSFCIVPYTRGPESHRKPNDIIEEIKKLTNKGVREITLLGQSINHYKYKLGEKNIYLSDLLFLIHENATELLRLRFLTSHPKNFHIETISVMYECDKIYKYLHIPAQSGSNKILKDMNRGYNIKSYINLIESARKKIPNISIAGDMIVGFPNETIFDFNASKDLLNLIKYKNIFIFKYSPRPDTISFKKFHDNITNKIKKDRNNEMLQLQNKISLLNHKKLINNDYKVLVISKSDINIRKNTINKSTNSNHILLHGKTIEDHTVLFYGEKGDIGKIVSIKIISVTNFHLNGRLINHL